MEKDMREKLLAAGEKLFVKKGLTGVSIRELSKEANANSALISYYFGGKEGLYAAVLERQFSPIHQLLDEVLEQPASPVEKIIQYTRKAAALHKNRPLLAKYLLGELNNPSKFLEPVARNYIERIFRFITESLREGAANGQFRQDLDIHFAAFALVGMIQFYYFNRPVRQYFSPDNALRDEQYITQSIEIFLNGVKNNHEQ